MSYKVKVRHVADSGSGISVEARVNGEAVAHTFPKGRGFFDEQGEARPVFVDKLVEKYKDKMRRKGLVAQLSDEESKAQSHHFENKVYTKGDAFNKTGGENFKEDNKQNNDMGNVDLDDVDEIRTYLKENMAEGYLSKEEGLNIDRFVDRYEELLQTKEKFQEIIREIQEDRVK